MSGVSRRGFLKVTVGGSVLAGTVPLWRPALAAEEIRIGALCELSGPASTIGVPQAEGIKMAVDDINKTGGVLGKGPGVGGRPLRLLLEDTESKVATGVAKAKKLVERDKVDALTGVIFSAISLAVQEYVNKEARVPFINAGSGNPAISEPPACGKYTFQGLPHSRVAALPSAYAAKKYGSKWFLIGDDYSWGRLTVQLTKDAVRIVGGELTVVGEEYTPFGTTNYAPYITKAIAAKPDVVGVVVFGAGYARILKQMKQMGLKAHIHHNFWSQVDANAAGDAVLGMTASHSYVLENPRVPRMAQFAKAYKARYNAWPDPAAAGGYNAIEVLALAMRNAGSSKPDAVVKAMETLRFSSLSGDYRFRECDHAALSGVFTVEGKFNDEYKFYPSFVEEVRNPDTLMIPCGQTRCEPAMKS